MGFDPSGNVTDQFMLAALFILVSLYIPPFWLFLCFIYILNRCKVYLCVLPFFCFLSRIYFIQVGKMFLLLAMLKERFKM